MNLKREWKRTLSLFLAVWTMITWESFCLAESVRADGSVGSQAEESLSPVEQNQHVPDEPTKGPGGDFSEMPPEGMHSGETPPEKPDGEPPAGSGPGGPGGQSSQPESYEALYTVHEDMRVEGETLVSQGKDENVFHVESGTLTLLDSDITRISSDSTGGDAASFYGVGAAILVTGGEAKITGGSITTDAAGGAGVFAYGPGVAYVKDTVIATTQDTSGGVHVAGGGTLYAENLTVTTEGESAAAIRSDRGSGTLVVTGGSYTSSGSGSPAVYVTADITLSDAQLTATGSEALCLEGRNRVTLTDCHLSGNMADLSQNDNTWTVILYQSMSGDSEVGKGFFQMTGGSLTSGNGGLFYTTNTESEFILENVAITSADDCEYFLRCTGNSNQRGWGQSGQNGADCTFTAIQQTMDGDILWDSISTLNLSLEKGSVLTGAIVQDESCAGEGGDGFCTVQIDETSTWIVTGDSVLTTLDSAGMILDPDGHTVTIRGTDGTVYEEGDSEYTLTVSQWEA